MRHAGIPFNDARVSTLPDASILSRRGIYIRLYGRPPRPLREASRMPGAPRSSPVDYRLAPEDPFPAAVEDALSVYHYLLERGYSPAQLVPVGISAGGTLALTMLLAGRRPGLLMPATGRSAITG
ncbi:alpha/beta hydrolase fold domain-containing protein [Methanoculleus sp.]|uniref:alpha/beta hydrolase fold domain-containing protein n=1 Tax=Methanoculleus sp. TaxID=90427 RepID=UPI00260582DA|nr:alpha/beta hydrolase fold domain-containing protein [Methanoculleus sp.]MDI6866753.1 alpha/beta hydrolase fold domain-containing protein [Methanoculleus sp.]